MHVSIICPWVAVLVRTIIPTQFVPFLAFHVRICEYRQEESVEFKKEIALERERGGERTEHQHRKLETERKEGEEDEGAFLAPLGHV